MEIGHYRADRLISESALGKRYEGVHRLSQRRVVVWLLKAKADQQTLDRLQALSLSLGQLQAAGVAGVVGLEECGRSADGTLYLISPMVKGLSLTALFAKQPGLPPTAVLQLGRSLSRTLASSQSSGIYHFALRPSQVLVDDSWPTNLRAGVHILGLGLTVTLGLIDVTAQGPVCPPFAAPEQYPARAGHLPTLGGRTDVFALGVLLWQALAGANPFPKGGPLKGGIPTLNAGSSAIPDGFAMILVRMVSPTAGDRPTMAEVAAFFTRMTSSSEGTDDEEKHTIILPSQGAAPVGNAPAVLDADAAGKLQAGGTKSRDPDEPSQFEMGGIPDANDQAEPADPRIDTLFGNFRLTKKLGEGGMGVVYQAKHRIIGRIAAVKIMHPAFAQNADYAARFLNEARSVNIIQHPGLVEIFEYGKLADGTLYIVMEFLRGESLQGRLEKQKRPFSDAEALGISIQIAHALAAAHSKGIIHRDLKPENIMLVPDPVTQEKDWVKILDFGIAKVDPRRRQTSPSTNDKKTEAGAIMGTPMYMAPEQFGKAEEVDGRADVFSLGVVLYELLAGQPPYQGNSLTLLNKPVRPLGTVVAGVSPIIAALVHRMMSVSSVDRPSMAEVANQLSGLRPSGVISGNSLRLRLRKRPLLAALIAGVVASFAIILAIVVLSSQRLNIPETREHALAVLSAALKSADVSLQIKALNALGQSGDASAGSLLKPLLNSSTPEVVAEAARALGQAGTIEAQALLVSTLAKQHKPSVQIAIAEALARLRNPAGVRLLTDTLERDETEPENRYKAATILLDLNNLAGAPGLWERLSRGNLSPMASLATLGQLALAGDAQARERLADTLKRSRDRQGRLFAAWSLAKIGDEAARTVLLDAASQPGGDQLLAAQFAAALGEPLGYDLFVRLVPASREPDAVRELAIAGLADCGKEDGLITLDKVLSQRHTTETLRLAAAGAILRIIAGDRTQLAQQSLNWARAALGSDSAITRELGAAALGEINSDETIPPLSMALRDQQRDVRRTAARALGRKSARAALAALAGSLDDQDLEVRAAGMRAIRRVVDALRSKGDRQADQLVLQRLEHLSGEGSEQDRAVASGILLQLGDSSQIPKLTASFSSRDPLVRKFAVEFADIQSGILERALKDGDIGVRFAAARRLADRGSHIGVAVLQEIAQRGDIDGLVAYGKLKVLGESATPPEGLSQVLQSGDLQTRFDALEATADLPNDRALALLYIASRDAAGVIRRRAVEVAGEAYKRTGNGAFLNLIKGLRRDSDAIVRSAAVELLPVLSPKPLKQPKPAQVTSREKAKEATDLPDKTAPDMDAGGKSATGPVSNGQLRFLGEESVRIQIDGGPSQAVPSTSISVAPGQHRISYAYGEQNVIVSAGQAITVSIPTTYAEQLLHDGVEAYQEKRLDRAQQCLERVRLLQDRGLVQRNLLPDLALSLARLYEAQNNLKRALQEYNRLSGMVDAQHRPELRRVVDRAMARLSPNVGHVVLFRKDPAGKCIKTDQYLPPGDHVLYSGWNIDLVDDAAGKVGVVRVKAGATVTVNKCR